MNHVFIYYFIINGIHLLPMVVVTLSLGYNTARPFFQRQGCTCQPLTRGLRNIGITRFEQSFQLFDSDIKDYLLRFSFLACLLEIMIMILIMLAIMFNYSLPFIPYINDPFTMDVMYELLMFTVATTVLQWLPMIGVVLAFVYNIRLPFMPKPAKDHEPFTDEIIRSEEESQDFASILLTRFENSEKIFIYATCRDDRLDNSFKLVLCQGKEPGAKPQCFQYIDEYSALKPIIPSPISVKELDAVFTPGNN